MTKNLGLGEQRHLFWPGPVASPKNVTEIWNRLFDSDWRDFTDDFGIVDSTITAVYDPVNELFSHHRLPLLQPALQGPQLLWADTFGMIAH